MVTRFTSPASLGILCLWAMQGLCLNPSEWYPCSSSSCNVTITQQCNKVDNKCELCVGNNATAACSSLSNDILSIGGNSSHNGTRWNCCVCDTNQTFCCRKCNASIAPSTTIGTAMSSTVMPTTTPAPRTVEYVRLLVIFFAKCVDYVEEKAKFTESFRHNVGNLTQLEDNLIQVDGINCSAGPKPYCGIEVESIHKHSRARRAVGGRRGSSGNTNKKDKIDTNFFAEYYNPEEPDCDGLAVNVSLRPPANDLTLNKTLELLLSHLRNRTFIISVYDGSYISAELILEAEKGSHFSLYTAPPLPYESRFFPAKVIPPLETNWMPLALTAGCIIGLVVLYVLIRLVKHSIFLRMKKFTNINSNKTTQTRLVKVQEEKKPKVTDPTIGRYDMTHNKLPPVDNEALSRGYDWTAPAYLPNMLTPAYRPADLYGQHSTPRLILDDSDGEADSPSSMMGRASVINLDADDEVFDDILHSDSEDSYKQKGKTSRARSTASGKSSGSGKSDTSGEKSRKSSAHSISQIKMRNKVSPDGYRRPSAISTLDTTSA